MSNGNPELHARRPAQPDRTGATISWLASRVRQLTRRLEYVERDRGQKTFSFNPGALEFIPKHEMVLGMLALPCKCQMVEVQTTQKEELGLFKNEREVTQKEPRGTNVDGELRPQTPTLELPGAMQDLPSVLQEMPEAKEAFQEELETEEQKIEAKLRREPAEPKAMEQAEQPKQNQVTAEMRKMRKSLEENQARETKKAKLNALILKIKTELKALAKAEAAYDDTIDEEAKDEAEEEIKDQGSGYLSNLFKAALESDPAVKKHWGPWSKGFGVRLRGNKDDDVAIRSFMQESTRKRKAGQPPYGDAGKKKGCG